MKPKVIFVAPSAYLISGLATWLDAIVPGLNRMGWDARILLVSGRHHHRPDAYLKAHPSRHVHVVHCDSETPTGRRLALQGALTTLAPDIAVSVNIPDVVAAVNELRRVGKTSARVVMSVHGIEKFLYSDMQVLGACLDAVVCTNRLSSELATRLGRIPQEKVRYAAYGVDVGDAVRFESPEDHLRIAYSGRLETPQKRCLDLIRLAELLEESSTPFVLDVAGDGPDLPELRQALSTQIKKGSVLLRGRVSATALREDVYAKAHALIITSYWETGPIVAWEAMAQGVCVVSTRYIGSRLEGALKDDDNALLFEIGNVEAAAVKLARLWRDPSLRHRIADQGKKLVDNRYSVDVSAQHWDAALKKILQESPVTHKPLAPVPTRGRLDSWFGPELGERLRRLLPSKHRPPASDAGGEWPHAYQSEHSDAAFWDYAHTVDRGQSGG